MNILFLVIASALVLLSLGFILPPLWRNYPSADSGLVNDQDQRNIFIARQRVSELNEQKQAGVISQAQYDEQFAELEHTLSDDLDVQSMALTSSSQGRWIVYVVALIIPWLAGALYVKLGHINAINPGTALAVKKSEPPSAIDTNKMIADLAERLKKEPNDAEGWLMLGRSYKYLEQYSQAVDAFANAYRLLGDQPEVMLLYAEAIAYNNNKNLAGKPAALITQALDLEPENLNALWLGGMLKAQQGDAESAIKMWQKLKALLPPDSEAQREMETLLTKIAGSESSDTPQPEVEANQASGESAVAIDVNVSLAPLLEKSVRPSDTVFIYAQALTGPKMPLAIVRKQVADLPVSVKLSDSMSMMPGVKLSNFKKVKLLARISKSGNAITQSGDLLGMIEQAELSDSSTHNIVIDSEVK